MTESRARIDPAKVRPLAAVERDLANLRAAAACLVAEGPPPSPFAVDRIRTEADRILAAASVWLRAADRPKASVTRGQKAARAASTIRAAALAVLPKAKAAWADGRPTLALSLPA